MLHQELNGLLDERYHSEFREFVDSIFSGSTEQYKFYKQTYRVAHALAAVGKVILLGRASRETLVRDILSGPAITVQSADSIEKCMQLMTFHRIRHLPVVDDGKLVGLISIGDLVQWVMHSQRHTILQLQGYIAGEYPG